MRIKNIMITATFAILAGCATSNTGEFNRRMQPTIAAVERGEMPISVMYRQFVTLSEMYLGDSASNRFTNRMVAILGDAAEAFEQGRITGNEFQSIKTRVETAMAQQEAAFSLAQDQSVRDIWLSRRPIATYPRRSECVSTLVFNTVRTVCN